MLLGRQGRREGFKGRAFSRARSPCSLLGSADMSSGGRWLGCSVDFDRTWHSSFVMEYHSHRLTIFRHVEVWSANLWSFQRNGYGQSSQRHVPTSAGLGQQFNLDNFGYRSCIRNINHPPSTETSFQTHEFTAA